MAKLSKQKLHEIDLSQIDEPHGVIRMEISDDRISELAQSISETGLLQPITVRKKGDRFEVVYGHRRYLACKRLELATIRSEVKTMTDSEVAVARATENLSRVDLTPIEEAASYKDLMVEHGMRVDQIAARVGKSPGVVKRRMDLLKMQPLLQKAVHAGSISMSVAEELWPITDTATLEYYLSFAIEEGIKKDRARQWCKEWRDSQRRSLSAGGEGGQVRSPLEPRPHYITCDICLEPAKIEDAASIMICPVCQKLIREKQEEV